MKAKVGNRTLIDDVLATTMCLVEQILNSRLLTSIRDDPENLEASTPFHFLLGRAIQQPHLFLTLSDIQISEEYSESHKRM